MILEQIANKRKEQLEREIKAVSRVETERSASFINTPVRDFKKALRKEAVAVIAEAKKASPSKGVIKDLYDPAAIAAAYEEAGADAISVLTEEYYFSGAGRHVKEIRRKTTLPILRKDFVIDPYQIYETRILGADAVLLIVSLLSSSQLKEFLDLAHFLSLACLVEIHDEREAEIALSCGAEILGINNRDLKTFQVSLETTARLASWIPGDRILVSESGISCRDDLKRVREWGADAVLIGETLMRSTNCKETLQLLRSGV